MLHPNWAKHCTLRCIELQLQQRGESRLTRSLLKNWRLGNFLSYFTRPSSQDHQKPIKRRLITFLCDFVWWKSLSADFFDSVRWICKLSQKQIYLEDYSCALHFKKQWLWPKKVKFLFIWSALSDSTASEDAGIEPKTDAVFALAVSRAGQCWTNPWPTVPDWTLMPECRCRTEAADYRKKCRCRYRMPECRCRRHRSRCRCPAMAVRRFLTTRLDLASMQMENYICFGLSVFQKSKLIKTTKLCDWSFQEFRNKKSRVKFHMITPDDNTIDENIKFVFEAFQQKLTI